MQAKENYHHSLFVCISFCTFVASRVITLWQSNEELRNTNGCYLVTQFSSSPTNRFILSELSFLAKVTKSCELSFLNSMNCIVAYAVCVNNLEIMTQSLRI